MAKMINMINDNYYVNFAKNVFERLDSIPEVIFSEMDSIVSFLSVILLRSSSIRSSHGEILETSKSGIS